MCFFSTVFCNSQQNHQVLLRKFLVLNMFYFILQSFCVYALYFANKFLEIFFEVKFIYNVSQVQMNKEIIYSNNRTSLFVFKNGKVLY